MRYSHDSMAGEILTRVLLGLIGLLMLVPAANKLSTYCSFRFLGTRTYGTVIHSSSSRDMGGRPLIQYSDGEGGLYEFKSRAKTHWFKKPVVGEKILIFYDKNEPHLAVVNSLFYYVFLPLLFIIVGGYCCLTSVWLYLPKQRRREVL